MDVVYVCRSGPNEELRYSLRSLAANVKHDRVWIVGGAPAWITGATVIKRQPVRDKYRTTSGHIQAACENPQISDPFMLWNDDFFAVRPVAEIPLIHLGPLKSSPTAGGAWVASRRQAVALLTGLGFEAPVSYETHLPLIVQKAEMRWALKLLEDKFQQHKRSVYGNLAGLGGERAPDCKVSALSPGLPRGDWLSSGDRSFRSTVLPIVSWLFPDPGPYESGR